MAIPDILQYMNVLRTSNSIRFMQLVTIFLGVWLAATGFIHLVSTSLVLTRIAQKLSFIVALIVEYLSLYHAQKTSYST